MFQENPSSWALELHAVCRSGHLKLVKFLIKAIARMTTLKCARLGTLFDMAGTGGDVDVARYTVYQW